MKAKTDLEAGKFKSVRQCAAFHKLPVSTLHRLFTDADEFQGSGRKSVSLSFEEETVIMNHVKWRSQIGCGMDFDQLQSLIQKNFLLWCQPILIAGQDMKILVNVLTGSSSGG